MHPDPEPNMATGGIIRPDLWANPYDTGCGVVPRTPRPRPYQAPTDEEWERWHQQAIKNDRQPPHMASEPPQLELIAETRPTIVRVRDWLSVVALAVTIVCLTVVAIEAIYIGAHYPPGQLPIPNAPVMPHPGVDQ